MATLTFGIGRTKLPTAPLSYGAAKYLKTDARIFQEEPAWVYTFTRYPPNFLVLSIVTAHPTDILSVSG